MPELRHTLSLFLRFHSNPLHSIPISKWLRLQFPILKKIDSIFVDRKRDTPVECPDRFYFDAMGIMSDIIVHRSTCAGIVMNS
jgi:hypothetical protein